MRFTQVLLAASVLAAIAIVGGYAVIQHAGKASDTSTAFSH
jgi:hypothetical protein